VTIEPIEHYPRIILSELTCLSISFLLRSISPLRLFVTLRPGSIPLRESDIARTFSPIGPLLLLVPLTDSGVTLSL